MPSYKRLQAGVASHPDMLVFFCGDSYITTSEYYKEAKDVFEKINSLGYRAILTDELPSADYPNDIIFNALPLGEYVFGLKKNLSRELVKLAESFGMDTVNVHQGYAKCSVCKVSENAIITADSGIAKAAGERGIDVLEIAAGHVRLDGYDCGFIGGASGTDGENVYFCGNVLLHPDGKRIWEFCEKHKKDCVSLSNEPLFDVGTLFFLSKV